MTATEIIQEIQKLPREEKGRLYGWISTEMDEFDAFFAWCDTLPKKERLTEEEILALPRSIPKRDRSL